MMQLGVASLLLTFLQLQQHSRQQQQADTPRPPCSCKSSSAPVALKLDSVHFACTPAQHCHPLAQLLLGCCCYVHLQERMQQQLLVQ
jgi:hypothetical protein